MHWIDEHIQPLTFITWMEQENTYVSRMAFNTSDTRQRAYNPIDTSNPHGTWIEEKSYNKTRPGATKHVLCGNWQEEVSLEGDMIAQGIPTDTVRLEGTKYRGGFESTPYLTTAVDPRERRPGLTTTQRVAYNEANGDIRTQQQPALGVRSGVRSEQILLQAKEALAEAESQRATASLNSTSRRDVSVTGSFKIGSSVHRTEPKRVVDEMRQDYLVDVPITLYTGNPSNGAIMAVQGKSAIAPSASSIHAKHTAFTDEKYTIGTLIKH